MKLAIISAMSAEHEQICHLLTDARTVRVGRHSLVEGRIGEHEVVLMQCGIGKVNAAIGATELIAHCSPDALISTGCAGGIDTRLAVMDVVVSSELVYHDVWCGEGNAYGQVQGLPKRFSAASQLVAVARAMAAEAADAGVEATRIHCGLICTGDKFITDREELAAIKTAFPDGLAVDMESAALAQTCHLLGVPFVSFRIISDTPGVDAHWAQYENFWDTMAHRSFGVTKRFLESV